MENNTWVRGNTRFISSVERDKYKKWKNHAPCKRWEIANVFHRIEKTDFQAFDFLLTLFKIWNAY